jgi:hypothetical protein
MSPITRRIWRSLEAVHAVTYFERGCVEAMTRVGLKGFWMGYFASRGAPMGAVPPAVIEATFYNFDPRLVRRAIPDAWDHASPEAILEARRDAAVAALEQIDGIGEAARRVVPLLSAAVEAAEGDGRVLFSANRALGRPDQPVAALWHLATCLREHRGDGHVAILVSEGISGIEAHQLVVAAGEIDDEVLRSMRGWGPEAWQAAKSRLRDRGLLDGSGSLTSEGAALRRHLEARTEQLAAQPYDDALRPEAIDLLSTVLDPVAVALGESGMIPT